MFRSCRRRRHRPGTSSTTSRPTKATSAGPTTERRAKHIWSRRHTTIDRVITQHQGGTGSLATTESRGQRRLAASSQLGHRRGNAGEPAGNEPLDASGYVGFWLKTDHAGITVRLAIDDPVGANTAPSNAALPRTSSPITNGTSTNGTSRTPTTGMPSPAAPTVRSTLPTGPSRSTRSGSPAPATPRSIWITFRTTAVR